MAPASDALDPSLIQVTSEGRARDLGPLVGREARGRITMAALIASASLGLSLFTESHRHPAWWLYPALVLAYAVLASLPFELGSGLALPTALAFVPMLFLLPAGHVPLLVVCSMGVSGLVDVVRGRLTLARAAVLPGNATFAIGAALVFSAAGEPDATWRGGAVLVGALLAQFAFDLAGSTALEWMALGVRPRDLLRPIASAFLFDALVAPIAFGLTIAATVEQGALLLPLPLVLLLGLFARERRERLDSALELSAAYRGTTLLLGDVIDADDAYTGEHSRQVVGLVLAVCDRLRVMPRERRMAEFTALLHDVGKIRIPDAIINKPGPLTAEERAIVNTHTIEGQRLLLRVGGLVGEVGQLVRSCHERWDGNGYPDGLADEDIPLVAAIVSCCDAYHAMTTDRPYRSALTVDAALAELQANRGTQFRPDVVDALVALIQERRAHEKVGVAAAIPSSARVLPAG